MTLVANLNLKGNPFEHYTAETEPNIADYAVRPPYLQAIVARAQALSSFILFGDRGSGKSATRITVYNEMWKKVGDSEGKRPFVVNLTDFSRIQELFLKGRLSDRDIVCLAAYFIIEQILLWLSSLEDPERNVYIEALDKDERSLILALIKGFYLPTPELDRDISNAETFRLLNSAWTTKSAVWISKRWTSIAKIVASSLAAFTKKTIDGSVDIAEPAEEILKSLTGDSANVPRAILTRKVEFVNAFGFDGVCILVDKLDETPATANSAEATARLIHPLLAHIQLLEVPGCSWILFLWSNVQKHFDAKHPVRLDKIAHANITWNIATLREMVDARVRFFSSGALQFSDLINAGEPDNVFKEIAEIAMNSPRELIKIMDIVFREHDARGKNAPKLLDRISLDLGQDKYSTETIGTWFASVPLQQVLRLGKLSFVNKDVQASFRLSDQGARVRIRKWEDEGLIRQSGTVPSDAGGKAVYQFIIADARVERIIARRLDETVGAGIGEDADEGKEDAQLPFRGDGN